MYQNIMLTLDGSALADEAIDRAMDLAATSGGQVVLLDVVIRDKKLVLVEQ